MAFLVTRAEKGEKGLPAVARRETKAEEKMSFDNAAIFLLDLCSPP